MSALVVSGRVCFCTLWQSTTTTRTTTALLRQSTTSRTTLVLNCYYLCPPLTRDNSYCPLMSHQCLLLCVSSGCAHDRLFVADNKHLRTLYFFHWQYCIFFIVILYFFHWQYCISFNVNIVFLSSTILYFFRPSSRSFVCSRQQAFANIDNIVLSPHVFARPNRNYFGCCSR